MKKLTLIDNWKSCYKLASFQIAMLLIVLESIQYAYVFMPEGVAEPVRFILAMAIPAARLIKQKTKDK